MSSRFIDVLVFFSIYIILAVIFPDPSWIMIVGLNGLLFLGAAFLTAIVARFFPNELKVFLPILAPIVLIFEYFDLLPLMIFILLILVVAFICYAIYSSYFDISFQENLYDFELLTAKPIKDVKKSSLILAIFVSLIILICSGFFALPIMLIMIGVSYYFAKKSYLTYNIHGCQKNENCPEIQKRIVEKFDSGEVYIAALKGNISSEKEITPENRKSPHFLILTNKKVYLFLENQEANSVIEKYNQIFENIKSITFIPKSNPDNVNEQKLELTLIDNFGFENNFIISNLKETQIKSIIDFFSQYRPISGLIVK